MNDPMRPGVMTQINASDYGMHTRLVDSTVYCFGEHMRARSALEACSLRLHPPTCPRLAIDMSCDVARLP